jgi:hypothetical protein
VDFDVVAIAGVHELLEGAIALQHGALRAGAAGRR